MIALSTLAAVAGIGDSAVRARAIAERLEPRLARGVRDVPPEVAAPGWLAIARTYLFLAEHDAAGRMAWRARATEAWNAYRMLETSPSWLEQERDLVAAALARR